MIEVASGAGTARRLHKRLVAALPGDPLLNDPTGISGYTYVWLGLSLAFGVACGIGGLRHAFAGPYVVQDDARTFLFWMERYFDPSLFPNDLMVDYFSAISPPAYTAINWVGAVVFGVDPFTLNKWIPLVLTIVTTLYAFFISMRLLPVPAAAFVAVTILNESLWRADAIPSGTPRAFIYPLFLAFLFYVMQRRYVLALCATALLGMFYPQMLTIAGGTVFLALFRWEDGRLRLTQELPALLLCAATAIVSLAIVAAATHLMAPFGPVVTAGEARRMTEFSFAGRTNFYISNPWTFWITGERSGMFPYGFEPPLIWLAVLFPVLVSNRTRFPLIGEVGPSMGLLGRVVVASFGMFAAAHLLLFRLHLPSRYTQHSLRMVMSLAVGIVVVVLLDALWGWLRWRYGAVSSRGRWGLAASTALALLFVVAYPAVLWALGQQFPRTQYFVGREPGLYKLLREQPKDIVIASLARESDLLPTFAQRSILTGYEYAIPYHRGYYSTISQRTHDLVRAQYTYDGQEVKHFIQKYGVTYWLLSRTAYAPDVLAKDAWIMQTQPEARQALENVGLEGLPVVARLSGQCMVYMSTRVVLLDAACVARAAGG
ncbi:MAG: hypothetical protein IT305_32875 [Chloroflexi bacterium]|nr:hypothetical protein [Chloroflexota bacterium]